MKSHRKFLTATSTFLLALVMSGCGAAAQSSQAETEGGSVSADDWSIDAYFTALDGTVTEDVYQPIKAVSEDSDWSVCALFPHVKDPLWVSANYGNTIEAERLGIRYNMYEADGYGNLSTQIDQMNDCIVQDYDAIILGAISAEGNCASIERALNDEIYVVDFINGTACGETVTESPYYTEVLVSYKDAAELIGEYMVEKSEGETRQVGVFPGPDGAAFANDAVDGFAEATADTNIETEMTRRGDTGLDVQLQIIEDALSAYPDMTDIFAIDIAAEAAVVALRNADKSGELGIYGYTMIPNVHQAIKDGDASAAVTDWTPYQGRMAVSQAVRALEGEAVAGTKVGPMPEVISPENIEEIAYEDLFGPNDFTPVYEFVPGS